jgi:hypothetical protein
MLETMYVRCTHCGYDNSPEYRFCGMCGASLAHPPVQTQAPEKKEVAGAGNGNGHNENVHGPSFLGLAEDPKTEFHYLYEDEQPRSHVGLVFFLLLIFAAAGYLGWQWKNHGYPFNQGTSSAAQPPAPAAATPAPNQNTNSGAQGPNNQQASNNGGVLPTEPDQKTQSGTGPKETDLPPQGGDRAATPTPNSAAPAENKAAAENPPEQKPEQKSAEQKPTQPTEEAKVTPPPKPQAKESIKNASKTSRASKAAAAAEPAAAPAAPDADLELSGERYLYGNGVPQNCTRAEANLRTAATHGNSKAQTVLGTMYATGHCVGRDLPTAYRWFARALHQDPQNSRISADLQVLWRQMTPQEKQLATTSAQ